MKRLLSVHRRGQGEQWGGAVSSGCSILSASLQTGAFGLWWFCCWVVFALWQDLVFCIQRSVGNGRIMKGSSHSICATELQCSFRLSLLWNIRAAGMQFPSTGVCNNNNNSNNPKPCTLCLTGDQGDEFHYVLVCSFFSEDWKKKSGHYKFDFISQCLHNFYLTPLGLTKQRLQHKHSK